MDFNIPKERKCIKENNFDVFSGQTKQIHVAIEQEEYERLLYDHKQFRKKLDELIAKYPERFPQGIEKGYIFHDLTKESEKLPGIRLRRIELKANGEVYSILPYFVWPYMKGYTEDLEKPLFLRRFGVPYWGLTHCFGRNDMFWYRLDIGLGRNSIVGTTISTADKLPDHLVADEKFSWENGEQVYCATTAANDCLLGCHIVDKADHLGLINAYGKFQEEALDLDPDYCPMSVTTDGWKPLRWAWQMLFPGIQLILCFLHSFLKVRDFYYLLKEHADTICSLIWQAYRETTEAGFRNQLVSLQLWACTHLAPSKALDAICKLCSKVEKFVPAFYIPGCYRTTAHLDRIMDRQDRFFYSCKYFHGHKQSSQYLVRAFALIHNFTPYSSRSTLSFISPAHRINGFVYHQNWLKNLHISSSMGGFFQDHRKR